MIKVVVGKFIKKLDPLLFAKYMEMKQIVVIVESKCISIEERNMSRNSHFKWETSICIADILSPH